MRKIECFILYFFCDQTKKLCKNYFYIFNCIFILKPKMIKEILEKSCNNIEDAKKLISEFKYKESISNPNHLNFHQINRKRRYEAAFTNLNGSPCKTQSINTLLSYPSECNVIHSNNSNQNKDNENNLAILNPFGNNKNFFNQNNMAINPNNNNNSISTERRKIKFNNKIYPINNSTFNFSNLVSNGNNNLNFVNNTNNNTSVNSIKNNQNNMLITNTKIDFNTNNSEVVNDQVLEDILVEVSQINSKEDIKSYLKNKITNLISKNKIKIYRINDLFL